MEVPVGSEDGSSDDDGSPIEGVIFPTLKAAEEDGPTSDTHAPAAADDASVPGALAEDDDESKVGARATAVGEDEDDAVDGGETGLLDAGSALASGADWDLDPFRTAGPLPMAPSIAPRKAAAPGFNMVKFSKEHPRNRKIHVSGLPSTTEAELISYFARFGKVQEVRLSPRQTSATVTFAMHKGAKFCLLQGADKEYMGHTIHCEVAQSFEERKSRSGTGAASRPSRTDPVHVTPGQGRDGGQRQRRRPPDRGDDGHAAERKKAKREKIVTVTRRPDAEPARESLRHLSAREIFPREFHVRRRCGRQSAQYPHSSLVTPPTPPSPAHSVCEEAFLFLCGAAIRVAAAGDGGT